MTRNPIPRLTPTVPGEEQPFLWLDGTVKTGFMSGGPTEGRGFPQWAKAGFRGGDIVHYFHAYDAYGVSMSLCGRVEQHWKAIFMPGNYPRCKDCQKRFSKMIRKQTAVQGGA